MVISITIFTVLDLDYLRFGLIRLTAADNALTQLRDSIRYSGPAGTPSREVAEE